MVSILALSLAVLVHTGFKILVFMDLPPADFCCCSLGPNLRSVLFLSSVVMYLSTTRIFPNRYRKIPLVAQGVVEFFVLLIAIELAMIGIWCRLEALLFRVFDCLARSKDSILYRDIGGKNVVDFLMTLCSMLTFALTAIGTGYVDMSSRLGHTMLEKVETMLERIHKPTNVCLPPNSEPNGIVSVLRQPRSRSQNRRERANLCGPRQSTPRRRQSRSRSQRRRDFNDNFCEPWQSTSRRK